MINFKKIKKNLIYSIKPNRLHLVGMFLLIIITPIIFLGSLEVRDWPPDSLILPILIPIIYLFPSAPWLSNNWSDYLKNSAIITIFYWYILISLIIFILKNWKNDR